MESSEGEKGGFENLYKFARLAVDKAKLCPVSTTSQNPPSRVGIVLEKNGVLLGWAAKGLGGEWILNGEVRRFKVQPHEHAEQALLAKLNSTDLIGASAYVTLEPCAKRRQGKSCAELLVSASMPSSPNFAGRRKSQEVQLSIMKPTVASEYSDPRDLNLRPNGQTVGRVQFMP